MSLRLTAERILAALPEGQYDPMLAPALWFLLWATEQGHTAIAPDTAAPLVEAFQSANDTELAFDLGTMLRSWQQTTPAELTGVLQDLQEAAPYKPVLTDGARLWLQRIFVAERDLARAFANRIAYCMDPDLPARIVPRIRFGPQAEIELSEGQQAAVDVAVQKPLMILTGGPGTGKTTVVAALLLALAEYDSFWERQALAPPVLLAAPTGKAAGRMNEALQHNLMHVHGIDPAHVALLQQTLQNHPATTLHRLLGASARPGGGYHYGAANPLPPASVIVIDEASMIDLPLMAQLMAALHPDTQLLLLGDPHQLPAVGLGTVLADLAAAPALQPWHVHLHTSHRFREGSHIYQAKQLVLGQEAPPVHAEDNSYVELVNIDPGSGSWEAYEQALLRWMQTERQLENRAALPFDWVADPAAAYQETEKQFAHFRVLCALREGPAGQSRSNAAIESHLRARYKLLPGAYDGQPYMLLQNSYSGPAPLFNGDIGFIRAGQLQCEPRPGMPDTLPLASLPAHELCYATTVHKSQGSEFQHILLLLPPQANPVVTRELLYTAITRVKVPHNGSGGITIVGPKSVYENAIVSPSRRHTGLPALLKALA